MNKNMYKKAYEMHCKVTNYEDERLGGKRQIWEEWRSCQSRIAKILQIWGNLIGKSNSLCRWGFKWQTKVPTSKWSIFNPRVSETWIFIKGVNLGLSCQKMLWKSLKNPWPDCRSIIFFHGTYYIIIFVILYMGKSLVEITNPK